MKQETVERRKAWLEGRGIRVFAVIHPPDRSDEGHLTMIGANSAEEGLSFFKMGEAASVRDALRREHLVGGWWRALYGTPPAPTRLQRLKRWFADAPPPIAFRETSFFEEEGYAVLRGRWIDGRSCERDRYPLSIRECHALGLYIALLHDPHLVVPEEIRDISVPPRENAWYLDRCATEYLPHAVRRGYLPDRHVSPLLRRFERTLSPRRIPAHADLWDQNLVRGEDGRFWIVDLEMAGLYPPGTDIVRFFLLMAGRKGQRELAEEAARTMREAMDGICEISAEEWWSATLLHLASMLNWIPESGPVEERFRALFLEVLEGHVPFLPRRR